MVEKIYCSNCKYYFFKVSKGGGFSRHNCTHPNCFVDNAIAPKVIRKHNCESFEMNGENKCEYFDPKLTERASKKIRKWWKREKG
jgi:hypothetical protein